MSLPVWVLCSLLGRVYNPCYQAFSHTGYIGERKGQESPAAATPIAL